MDSRPLDSLRELASSYRAALSDVEALRVELSASVRTWHAEGMTATALARVTGLSVKVIRGLLRAPSS